MSFSKRIINHARILKKTIVLPESDDPRILKAANILKRKRIVRPVLVGNPVTVKEVAKKNRISLRNIEIVYPQESDHLDEYADELFKLRRAKGMLKSQAKQLIKKPVYYAAMLVHKGFADGMVSGATHPSKDTIKTGIHVIGIRDDVELASSLFFMEFPKNLFVFADCGFVVEPNFHQLAHIGLETARTVRDFDIDPHISFLSYSTKGSGHGNSVTKVQKAVKLLKKEAPSLVVDGELQFDAAFDVSVRERKDPNSPLGKKPANVYVFPNLDSGNIGYKIAQRLGGAHAFGPILQGFKKPINDLSRGASVQEIIVVAAITAVQASHREGA